MAKYCPDGDGVFEDWVERCPECGRTLTDRASDIDPIREGEPDLVRLATAPNQPEAEMWAGTIRAEGIPVLLKAGGPGFGAWASVSMFEHELYVHRQDLPRARRIANWLLNTSGRNRLVPVRRTVPPVRNPVVRRR
jgi:hypothetical protein